MEIKTLDKKRIQRLKICLKALKKDDEPCELVKGLYNLKRSRTALISDNLGKSLAQQFAHFYHKQ